LATSEKGTAADGLIRAGVMLVVRDSRTSVAFYQDILGFELLDYPHIPLLRRGTLELFLVEESPPTADRPNVTLAPPPDPDRMPVNLVFEVDDAHAEYARLAARGLSFLTPPTQPPWGGWRCFAQDPDGYLIEIEQPPAS
jgi:catechol 2,3-dioxygenase-like lactoylglutathione lyase family enzyme